MGWRSGDAIAHKFVSTVVTQNHTGRSPIGICCFVVSIFSFAVSVDSAKDSSIFKSTRATMRLQFASNEIMCGNMELLDDKMNVVAVYGHLEWQSADGTPKLRPTH